MTPEQEKVITEFLSWFDKAKPEITTTFDLLVIDLSDEPEAMIRQMKQAEAHYVRCGSLRTNIVRFLSEANKAFLPEKQGKTEKEREIEVIASVSALQEVHDELDNLCVSIKQRLIAAESLLAHYRQFPDHGNG